MCEVEAAPAKGLGGPRLAEGDTSLDCSRLIRSAAYAAGCPAAVFFLMSSAGLEQAGSIGLSAVRPESLPCAWSGGTGSVVVLDDVSRHQAAPLAGLAAALALDGGAPVRFLAAVPVISPGGAMRGVLAVADSTAHAGLSPAQTYVLSTHGLQLGACLELHQLRGAARAHRPAGPETERLRLLESVVVHANDAVLITEAEPVSQPGPRIVYCNAAFTKTTGYTEAEILGLTPRILQAPGIHRPALDRLRAALERWEPVEVELLNVKKDGTEFWVELSIVPVADETGWYTHWVSVQRDVSHRKQAEEVAVRARIAEVENKALEAEIAQRKLTEERLRYAASHDDLTRLRNRAYLMDRLTSLLARSSGQDGGAPQQCAVLFLDLDRFKLINDSLGHRVGDLLLMEMAQRLKSCVRPGDTLARIGGDEFAVLVEGPDEVFAAVTTAERIAEALARPFKLGAHDMFSLCSIGIAQASPAHTRAEELLRDADLAMYAAKKRGGGGYTLFRDSMHAGTIEALALQTDLRHAIARSEFHLHYQPIFDPETLRLTGLEALIRWFHPVRGLVSPAEFIPIAEEIGVIRDVDRWVLREACTQMKRWREAGLGSAVRMSVNVSGDELRDRTFIPELRAVLDGTGMDPRRLQLEITESVFLHKPALIGQVLMLIREMGARIAIDDFGTGYSSLGYLDRYELDAIKIDQSFVARMLGESRTFAVVDAIVRLGATLRLDTVAEGVETEAQLAMLRSMSCGHVQGYLLGRPMPAAEVTALLELEMES